MKNIVITLLFCLTYTSVSAQITAIPDPGFEQVLIDLEIDSDGIINGQVLTSDIENVTELTIDTNHNSTNIYDLAGIEGFINLEKLTVIYSWITTLDVSHNLQLKELNCSSNQLTGINVSNNILLKKLYIGNTGDIGPFNEITEIDLTNNLNIDYVEASNMPSLDIINLKNGNNNTNMTISIGYDFWGGPEQTDSINTVCIQIDNEALAQNNQLPYSEWTMHDWGNEIIFSENCALNTSKFQKDTVTLYPNPATNILNLTSKETITEAAIYNLLGQKVKQLQAGNNAITADVSSLTAGTYFVVVKTGIGNSTEKLVVK